jgi:hypothetical protein
VGKLNDPLIEMVVGKTYEVGRRLGSRASKTLEQTNVAYEEAVRHPGSVIRIYGTSGAMVVQIFDCLQAIDDMTKKSIDWERSSDAIVKDEKSKDPRTMTSIWFRNGSVIEIAYEAEEVK